MSTDGRLERGDRRLRTTFSEALAELAWPTRCVGCEAPGELLCNDCRAALPWIAQHTACPFCGAPLGDMSCPACAHTWQAPPVVAALSFEGVAARMIRAYKDAHELRLASYLASALATAFDEARSWQQVLRPHETSPLERIDCVCFVPATPEAYARRGRDHMEEPARIFAKLTGLPYADILVRASAADQRGLTRSERARNLAGTISVVGDVSGAHVLVLDDVVTTGASMHAAAEALCARGAAEVSAAAVARVW